MKPTLDLARAAGQDAGNRAMRAGGRTSWNAADYRAAARTMASLIPSVCDGLEHRVITETDPTHEALFVNAPIRRQP